MPETHQKRTDGASGYVSLRRAASQLGLPYGPLRRAVAEGRLPTIKLGRRWLVEPETIKAALEDNSAASIEEEPVEIGEQFDLFASQVAEGGRDE